MFMQGWQKCALLHYAAIHSTADVVGCLVDLGADPNVTDEIGWTPIFAACYYGRREMAKELARMGADPKIVDKYVSDNTKPSPACVCVCVCLCSSFA